MINHGIKIREEATALTAPVTGRLLSAGRNRYCTGKHGSESSGSSERPDSGKFCR